jgi:signal transduction histidine kinase
VRGATLTARSPLVGLICSALVVSVITLLIYPLQHLDPGVSSGVLYVLGVLLIAINWGLWLGLLTSLASAAALNYFHASPTREFLAGKDAGDLVAIGTLLLTGFVASAIADRARSRAERVRLQEVRASRARVLAAADEERRRVVRDLHDGAQQRLVHTVVTLKLARQEMQAEGTAIGEALVNEALHHAEHGTTELRELVHGILPSALTRGGLQAGIEELAARIPVPFSADISVGRLPPAIEATAYFVVAEALTNVVKHSRADSAAVTAALDGDLLRVEVRDSGVGGARRDANGLLGLQDRLSALDGRLRVESPPGRGTVIAAEIPVRA